jgi:hypothetical protein
MLDIFTKTLIGFIDKSLSALLLGAAFMIILFFNTWKIPEKWKDFLKNQEAIADELEEQNKRLTVIEQVQRRILDRLKFALKDDKDSDEL